eukprot:scaffold56142_cov15-Tisochrysis_lutea.AAC.1
MTQSQARRSWQQPHVLVYDVSCLKRLGHIGSTLKELSVIEGTGSACRGCLTVTNHCTNKTVLLAQWRRMLQCRQHVTS